MQLHRTPKQYSLPDPSHHCLQEGDMLRTLCTIAKSRVTGILCMGFPTNGTQHDFFSVPSKISLSLFYHLVYELTFQCTTGTGTDMTTF